MKLRPRVPRLSIAPLRLPNWRSGGSLALDLLYPRRCVACGVFETDLCDGCEARMTPTSAPGHCGFCRATWEGEGFCDSCFGWDALDGARAPFEMAGPARRVVHALKYTGVQAMSPVMAQHVAPLFAELEADRAFAVPLHGRRQKERGFNQAEVLLNQLQWPRGDGALRRVRKTRSQVGMTESERRRNVAGAFAYEGPELRGETILLLDDVITTGATVNECARVLRDFGARKVYAVAFARAGVAQA